MYSATWPNVDLEHNILTVPRSKHGETRHVTLNSAAKTMLEFLKREGGGKRVCVPEHEEQGTARW